MTMLPIQLGARPLADFSEPLQMLEDCHRRIEHFLDVLKKVAASRGTADLTDEARRALDVALTYFSHAAPRHTADEEQSLFPRMRNSSDPAVLAALDELDGLESEHRRAEAAHDRVDALGRQWLAAGRLSDNDLAELQSRLDELSEIYAVHIRHEEDRVFALAANVLSNDDLQAMGQEMRDRRGLAN